VDLLRRIRLGADLGLRGEVEADFTGLLRHRDRVVSTLVNGVQGLLRSNGVTLVSGSARVLSPDEVEVRGAAGSQRIKTRNLLLATGSVPARPRITGLDLPGVVDSTGLLALREPPRNLVVIGGGHIGLEFASVFAHLGTRVTVLEVLPRVLNGFDEELANRLQRLLESDGVRFHLSVDVQAIEQLPDGRLAIRYLQGRDEGTATGDTVLYATGRVAYTEGLGLDSVGIRLKGPALEVNERMQTSIPCVYAAGDVVFRFRIGLAHVAWTESQVAIQNIVGRRARMEYRAIPAVVHSIPELAGVGLTESAALEQGYRLRVGRSTYSTSGRALGMGEPQGTVKLITEAGSGDLLGAHVVGPHASDLIAELAVAMEMGATARDVEQVVHAHPTLSEVVQEAARNAGRATINPPGP
ncbi:MAG: NAD(P)/FAD-dependent oxidoreductase, partial [Chloroflexota bacterium]|nr:NAD(P)/FAD-dependent oxidoreductase [Chloroflexota bacterium]